MIRIEQNGVLVAEVQAITVELAPRSVLFEYKMDGTMWTVRESTFERAMDRLTADAHRYYKNMSHLLHKDPK